MARKKPSGDVGFNRISHNQDSVELSWNSISFPTSKDEIEKYFCERFVYQFRKSGAKFYRVEQNEENNFDFTLNLPGGQVFLDLAEIIIQNPCGNPYTNESIKINFCEYSEAVYKIIEKKSLKYQTKSTVPIHLLLYYTHWRFAPTDQLIALMQYDLSLKEHIFENIFLYCPIDEVEGELRVLFPAQIEDFKAFDFEKVRNNVFYNLNPGKFELFNH